MKKGKYVMISVLSCILLFNTLGCYDVSATGLQITFSTNPTIVTPGTNRYLEVNLKSVGGAVGSIVVSARSLDTSAVIAKGNWDVVVGSLDNGESHSVLYEFIVPSTASLGLYQIAFEITGSFSTIKQTAVVQVQDATVLDLASVTPTSIRIGEAATLIFNITNNGGVDLHNILFTWKDPNSLILPLGADNKITVSTISALNYTLLPIVVMASSGLSPGIYPLTITMDYYDQTGIRQLVNSTVGLQISGTTTFDVVVQTSTSTSISFAIVNTGANTASSVVVSIPTQPNYATSGSSSTSIGNLNAGAYTLASFQLSSTASNTTQNGTMQIPSFNRTEANAPPGGRNFTGGRNMFLNQSFAGMGNSQLLVQIAYTDVFGIRQIIQKQVNLSSSTTSGFSSRSTTQALSGTYPGGLSGQTQSSDLSNSVMYIAIGVAGIVIIVAVIQLGRKKKLSALLKRVKGKKE